MSEINETLKPDKDASELVEGVDFYFEDDLMVLTKKYLLERGYCCGNKCRHCPYGHENVPFHRR